jgi:hypothetical protein
VHHAAVTTAPLAWCIGAVGSAVLMLVLARLGLAHCETDLQRWYERHHGKMVLD